MMAGSTSNTKDSAGKRLGIKKMGRAEVLENEILVRQRGFKWRPGYNVHHGRDHTIHSSVEVLIFCSFNFLGLGRMEYMALL